MDRDRSSDNGAFDTTQDVMLDRMTDKALKLINGDRGDVGVLCEVVCDMALVMASLTRGGCRLAHRHTEDPAEALRNFEKSFREELQTLRGEFSQKDGFKLTWPALWAYLATLGTFGMFLWVLVDHLLGS